jgi:hypothetical protein
MIRWAEIAEYEARGWLYVGVMADGAERPVAMVWLCDCERA